MKGFELWDGWTMEGDVLVIEGEGFCVEGFGAAIEQDFGY